MLLSVGGLDDGAVAMAAGLDAFAVYAGGTRRREAALPGLLFAVVIDIFEVEGVEVAGDVAIDARLAHDGETEMD